MTRSISLAVALIPLATLAAEPGRGEKALRASFYLNTVPTMVEMVGDLKKDVLDAVELDPKKRASVEKALADHWTEQKIYAHAAAALEKQLAPEVLDAAIAQMTPEVQAMVKAGIGEATPEQAQKWMEEAKKHPDAKERRVLGGRIAAHMPQAAAFKEMLGQIPEVLADAIFAVTGADEARATLKSSFLEGMQPALAAMEQKDVMEVSAVLAYRDQPTAKLRTFAAALDSEAGKKLQIAAPDSLIAGAKKARADIVAQLKKGGGAKKK